MPGFGLVTGFGQSLRTYRRQRIAELLLSASLGTGILAFPVDPAAAACSLNAVTFTETCTGDISPGESFTAPTVKTLDANSLTANVAPASGTSGLSLTSVGGNGGNGTNGAANIAVTAGSPGTPGDNLTINYSQPGANPALPNSGAIVTINAPGIVVTSTGGNGGTGGNNFIGGDAAAGGDGGSGGNVTVNALGSIATSGPSASGIVAQSSGGNGGTGGDIDVSAGGHPGVGGHGGPAGTVTVSLDGRIVTNGTDSNGIFAVSRGGAGGNTGHCGAALICIPANAGDAALGNTVTVTTTASSTIETFGSFSNGIYAASIGGFAGGGGGAGGVISFGSNGASAGDGGAVNVTNAGTITTHGVSSYGIFAQSVGGGGGGGGSSGGLISIVGSVRCV